MPWVRLDDQFYNHPKLPALGSMMLPCVGLHVLALCYANDQLTDGFIPAGQVPRLAGELSLLLPEGHPWGLVERLVAVGLWEEAEGGYLIHDFLEYQRSRSEVEALRTMRQDVGKIGGLRSAQRRAQPNAQPKAQAKSNPIPIPIPKKKEEDRKPVVLADDQFLAALRENPAYKGIDLDQELGRMRGWLLTPRAKGRKLTRQFIVNWLNKIDRPMGGGEDPGWHPGKHVS